MTPCLAYFVKGFSSQLQEIKIESEQSASQALWLETIKNEGRLKERQLKILQFIFESKQATLTDCEENLFINRRTLQRDIKQFLDMNYLIEVATSPTDPNKYYKPVSSYDKL